MLNLKKKLLIKYSYNKYDTGSTEVQIILLFFRIIKLKNHIKNNLKDINSKVSLIKIIGKKSKLLKYLKKKNKIVYNLLLIDLNK